VELQATAIRKLKKNRENNRGLGLCLQRGSRAGQTQGAEDSLDRQTKNFMHKSALCRTKPLGVGAERVKILFLHYGGS